jgi:hypothetical protein
MNSKAKSFLFSVIAVLLGFLIVLLALEIILRFFPVFSGMPVNKQSEIYSFVPNTTIQRSLHWNMTGARKRQVNNFGFISDQAYIPASQIADTSQSSKPLIAIIGDSYIEGMQVDYSNTTEANLLKYCSDSARVYSFGAQFAPLSQYLSWAQYVSQTFAPKAMVVNIVGNDFDEGLLNHQMSSNGGGIPGMQFFEFTNGNTQLVVVPFIADSPLTRILRHSALAQYLVRNVGIVNLINEYHKRENDSFEENQEQFNSASKNASGQVRSEVRKKPKEFVGNSERSYTSERLSLSQKAVDEFLKRLPALANLSPQSIMLSVDAERPQIYTTKGRQDLDSFFSVMRSYFIEQARAQGFQVIDLRPAMIAQFNRTGERFEFIDDNHWNAAGHQLLANQLLQAPPIASLCNSPKSIR